jgi:hypothetical protein
MFCPQKPSRPVLNIRLPQERASGLPRLQIGVNTEIFIQPRSSLQATRRRCDWPLEVPSLILPGNGCANVSLTIVFTEAEVICVGCLSRQLPER